MFILQEILAKLKNEFSRLAKAMSAAVGSFTRAWQSWYRLHPQKRPISSAVLTRFLALRVPVKPLLHLYGITQDSMATAVAEALPDDSRSFDR